ncbi:MAG TPA: hypothetical protein VLA21_11620 [Candidatus Limnocylindria bacterium]|nr:hypothetical protein [Candidatus Limnocylindria bacterium]
MIPSLFAYTARLRAKAIAGWLAAAFALGALMIYLFTPGPLAGLQDLRGALPQVLAALGYMGGASAGVHALETVYGFLFPLMVILHAVSSGADLYARPLADGRMAALLAAPHSRAGVLGTLMLEQAAEVILLCAACLAGQALAGAVFIQDAQLPALARLMAGFFPVCLAYAAFSAFSAQAARTPRGARRLSLWVSLLTLAFLMMSRFQALSALRFLTPFSLHRGLALASGMGGWAEALSALPLALALYAASLLVFSRRDL